MGRIPVIAAPMAAPVVAFSDTGNQSRCLPNSHPGPVGLVPAYHGLQNALSNQEHP